MRSTIALLADVVPVIVPTRSTEFKPIMDIFFSFNDGVKVNSVISLFLIHNVIGIVGRWLAAPWPCYLM